MAFDLRITEIFPGQSGSDLTSDWFEITNTGTSAWVQGVDPNLFYDDESQDPTTADQIDGLATLAPGETAIVLVDSTDVAEFQSVWGAVVDLTNVQIGTIANAAGLGGGGDAVALFADAAGDGVDLADLVDFASYPDTAANDGASFDVISERFSLEGVFGAVATTALGGNDADTPNVGSPGAVPVAINELRIDQSGDDNDEFFELSGAPNGSLEGLTYLVIGDGAGGSGTIEAVVDLSGQSLDANGFFLAAEGTFSQGMPDLVADLNFENSDNVTHLLVSGFTGANGDDLDTDDDGTPDVAPWTAVFDSVALVEDLENGDLIYSDTQVGPDGNFVPAHVYRETDGTGEFAIGSFSPLGEPTETPGRSNAPAGPAAFTLELLHIADQEAGAAAVADAPNLSAVLNALRAEDLGDDGMADNTLTLSSGDAIIPGLFYDASADVFGSAGIGDIQIQNELGIQAIALGNHEFDFGTAELAALIDGSAPGDFSALSGTALDGLDFGGTDFTYLSANLDFSADPNLAPLEVAGGQAPQGNVVSSSTVIDVNAELIGVVGATTPTLASISSPGSTGIAPQPFGANPTDAELDALAAEIQSEVDTLLADNPTMNKVVLLSHMQQINIEQALAERLTDVDIIVAGGSNTRLFDEDDRARAGDSDQGQYPLTVTNAGGTDTLVVNTDGSYKYVGRLVVDFDADGNIITDSYDAAVSGAFATDDLGVLDVALGALDPFEMSEAQQVGTAVPDTAATGSVTVTEFDPATGMVTISGTFSGLQDANASNALLPIGPTDAEGNPTSAIHLHSGAAGENGPIVRNFTVTDNGDGSGSFTGSFTLTPEELQGLVDGDTYVNLHTTDFNSGQLRGQVDIPAGIAATGLVDTEVQAIADAIEAQIVATESNVFGVSDVFLNGNRSGTGADDDPDGVRTQETNLGNLTADANLAAAQEIDNTVVVSIKNGGGIRASIGETVVPAGGTEAVRSPNGEVVDGDGNVIKPAGGISQNDIQTTLAFNNGLTLLTLTRQELIDVLEHGVSALPGVSGRFPQVSGVEFSYDADNAVGERVIDAAIVDPETGDVIAQLAENGAVVGDPAEEFRIVTLDFLAAPRFDDNGNFTGAGDGYPFPNTNTDPAVGEVGADAARVNPVALEQENVQTGDATFADDGTEQDALAEYLNDNFNPANGGTAFNEADTGPESDSRIIDVDAFDMTPDAPVATEQLTFTRTVVSSGSDSGAEIPAFDAESGKIFVAGGQTTLEVITLAPDLSASNLGAIDIAALVPGASSITSVATANGIVAAAVQVVADGAETNGVVAFFNASDNSLITTVGVGIGPDSVAFSKDGTKVVTADEGENDLPDADPAGSISVIDVSDASPANWTATISGFADLDAATLVADGVRLFPGLDAEFDLEPEYVAISPDSSTAYVTLQEANAIATVDLATGEITSIEGLGTVDHSQAGNEIDPSDEDGGFNLQTVPTQGLRMPDGLASFEIDGQTYFITANEGDARDEDERIASVTLDPTTFPDAADLQQPDALGRLQVSTIDGDTDGDGDLDQLFSYGGRSFTIFDDAGTVVFDSGSMLALIADEAGIYPEGRSDNKGTEPENVTVGQIGVQTFAFVALERANAIAVFDVSDPAAPEYVNLVNDAGDIGPEGLIFVPAMDSPSGTPLLVVTNEVSNTTVVHEIAAPGVVETTIAEVQGASHVSPFVLSGQTEADFFANLPDSFTVDSGVIVRVEGVVTAVDSNGFYLQDPTGDGDDATSEAIFVFTGSAPGVTVGDSLGVTGEVSEFFPGGTGTGNLPTTQIASPTIETVADLGTVSAELIGQGGRVLPNMTINDDSFASFDVATDGQDAFEALEGMLVTAQNLVAVSGTNRFGEIFAVTDQGADATGLSERGTLNISPDDFNPEKLQIDEDSGVFNFDFPDVNVGDVLGDVTGVVNYSFGNFEIIPTVDFTPNIVSGGLTAETTEITVGNNEISIASYNVLNLDTVVEDPANLLPNVSNGVDDDLGNGRFDTIAAQIATNLNAPDIIGLQEIQDNTGAEGVDSVTSASETLQALIDSIEAAGGPTYAFVDNTFIGDDLSGGIPGGNIRTAFLYNPERVSLDAGSVQTISGQGMGEAFEGGRLPLVATFNFGLDEVTVVNNHFSSKGGSAPILGIEQDFADRQEDVTVNGSLDERQAQSQAVQDFVTTLLEANPDENVVVLGDLNEFEFVSPVTDLEGAGLVNLTNNLAEDERYTFNFQGNSQSLDHILVSGSLAQDAEIDVVHVNSEFAETAARASDHDPVLAKVDFGERTFEEVMEGFELSFAGLLEASDLTINGQQVTFGGTTFTVDADLDMASFLSAFKGETTELALVEELLGNGLDLIENQAVDASQINGVAFDDYLIGNGMADFTVTLDSSTAGFDNSLGYYVYDAATMTASDVTILAANVKDPGGTGTFTIENVAADQELAFFVVRDGADVVQNLSDTLVFDFSGGVPQLEDMGVDVDVDIYHSLGAAFNPDGIEHFLSGSVDNGGALRVGVEDLLNAGDADYQDVVFTVTRDEDMLLTI
ncbi:MAG: choice-of-anchor I family protein [Pseudomonadota bacterium]